MSYITYKQDNYFLQPGLFYFNYSCFMDSCALLIS